VPRYYVFLNGFAGLWSREVSPSGTVYFRYNGEYLWEYDSYEEAKSKQATNTCFELRNSDPRAVWK
jgi:hypothetical protein